VSAVGSVRQDVDRGLEIRAKIAELERELEGIEERLQAAGLEAGRRGEHVELKDAEREGKQWLAKGSAVAVPLIFTADKLIGSFTANGAMHQTIRTAAAGHLAVFYKAVNQFKILFDDGKRFRAKAQEVLAERAPAFVSACLARDKAGIPKSDIKILWPPT
jgi:hypothetical protein